MELILATRNEHKLREVTRLLAPFGLSVAPLPASVELPPEDGDTFEANALVKACVSAQALARPVIADDSGIEAEALGGRPGVRSARFAGEHATDSQNLAKLLAEAPAGSPVRYVCALAYVDGSDGKPGAHLHRVFFGECGGRLAKRPRGERGFGYDPAFLPDDGPEGVTMAELEDATKDTVSHRGLAVRAFAHWFTAER